MNVERAELKVLTGALDTLWRLKPAVVVEVNGGVGMSSSGLLIALVIDNVGCIGAVV